MNVFVHRLALLCLTAAPGCVDQATLLALGPAGGESTGVDDPAGEADAGMLERIPEVEYCRDAADWQDEAAAVEEQLVELINDARAQGGACGTERYGTMVALQMGGALRCAARAHAKDMYERVFFDDENPEGETVDDRVRRTGVSYAFTAETIASEYPSAQAVFDNGLDNPWLCRNLLDREFVHVGVGYYPGPEERLWTVVLGIPH